MQWLKNFLFNKRKALSNSSKLWTKPDSQPRPAVEPRQRPNKLLLTYFEPFDGRSENSSALVVKGLLEAQAEGLIKNGLKLEALELPVVFEKADQVLAQHLNSASFEGLLMFGEAIKRKYFSLEIKARNIQQPRIPDNAGILRQGAILEGEAEELKATWPIEELFKGLDSEVWVLSEDAGEYVCNELFYRQLHRHRLESRPVGFVHVPLLSSVGPSGLSVEEGIEAALQLIHQCGVVLEK